MTKPGLAPRRAALWLVSQVTGEGRLMSDLLPGAVERLEPADRARAQRLAMQTLRWMDRADRMLGPHLKKRPPLDVHNILRLAVVEICVEGEAPHAVVDTAVSLARSARGTARFAGLVNAVLRNVGRTSEAWLDLPLPRLPKWLRKPLLAAYGKAAVEAMEAAHAAGAPLDLTPKDGDAAALAARLDAEALPTGSVRLPRPGQVSALPGYAEGDWWVQDAAAAIPARILDARPGERVLDMCAAPGGKTLQLAAAGAEVTALDLSPERMTRVRENLSRTGLTALCVTADARDWTPPEPFDAILLDAPCSATGTIRRHPDLPHARNGSEIPGLVALQGDLIDRAVRMLRPGGRLVFCTCSLLPEEGEAQLAAALGRHPGLAPDDPALDRPGIGRDWRSGGGLRLRPDHWAGRGGMDGFFIAALRKRD